MFLIDTNIFIEVLAGQGRAQECRALLGRIESGGLDCACSHFAIHSACLFLERHNIPSGIRQFLEYLLSLENLVVLNTSLEDDLEIRALGEQTGLDFDDSLQCYVARQIGCEAIITLDADFRKAGIATLAPRDVK